MVVLGAAVVVLGSTPRDADSLPHDVAARVIAAVVTMKAARAKVTV